MEPSKELTQDRSCNTCEHHKQERTLSAAPDMCWTCVNTNSLIHWEPISILPKPKTLQKALLADLMSKPILSPQAYAALHQETEATSTEIRDNPVAGKHYTKLKIQPMEYSMANKLDACQHTAIKYITRFRDKNGEEDLDKAIYILQLLKTMEYGSN